MWALENNTPFATERVWVRDRNGAEIWVVAVKGTFNINPDGSTCLAEKQEEMCRVPVYMGEPGLSSLLYESDMVQWKLATDVILHGHAYAPNGKAARQIDVRLRVANTTKTLRVSGDRYWDRGVTALTMTDPHPFLKIPIIYERAFGGVDTRSDDTKKHGWEPRNPVGAGFAVSAEHVVGQKVPNVEDPRSRVGSWDDRPSPAGFGPIACHWSPRVELAGTYDEKWKNERFPLVPTDFDDRFHQCAPRDQQIAGYLRGGESVELINLTPGGSLRFTLPIVAMSFATYFYGKPAFDHEAVLNTVILEPDLRRVMMVWETELPCFNYGLKLERTVIDEGERARPCAKD
ncbi:MAG: DUF2169 domain-containing protein [Syntrophorhabdales bacterium]|jgi:hypothetical protein